MILIDNAIINYDCSFYQWNKWENSFLINDFIMYVMLICWLGVFLYHKRILHHLETSPLLVHVRPTNFDIYSALMAIGQWGLFNVPHLLRHGPAHQHSHLRGPLTLTPVAERLELELLLPVLSRLGIEPRTPALEANALPLRHRGCSKCMTEMIE